MKSFQGVVGIACKSLIYLYVMNFIDIVIIIPLLWAAFRGFKRGLVIELATLASLGLGIYGAIKFSDYVAALINQQVEVQQEYLPLLAFGVTFIGIVVGVYFIGKWVEKIINMAALKTLNKLAGAVFSIAKFAMVISVLILILESADEKMQILPPKITENSLLYKPVSGFAPMVIPAIKNSEVFESLMQTIEELDLNFEENEES